MSGAATNSGINYQQRISALVLVAQYVDFDLSGTFGISQSLKIKSVHYETGDPIDDLKINCKEKTLFLQIKRSLSLQTSEESDLYKTLFQFIKQFSKGKLNNEAYVLITSPSASKSITQELAKILNSIRLNPRSLDSNPLNKSEVETLEAYKKLFNDIYSQRMGAKPQETDFIRFSKCVYISTIDIEQNKPNEQVALILLRGKGFVNAELVWNTLITNSLEYARNRQSIDAEALGEILDRYAGVQPPAINLDDFDTEVILRGEGYPVAKEVLLIESFVDKTELMIVELFRFTDEGKMKNSFQGNKMILSKDESWTVLQRAATFAGLERYLIENESLYKGKKITMIPAHEDIENAEKSNFARLHEKYLKDLLTHNNDVLKCLHCGKALDPTNSLLIEVEDIDSKPAIGNIHKRCLRPIDRIMGISDVDETYPRDAFLKAFDYKDWAKLLIKGQGMIRGIAQSHRLTHREQVISWSHTPKNYGNHSYCIRFLLSNGSSRFMTDRQKIHRFSKSEVEDARNHFQSIINKGRAESNPLGYTSKNFIFGSYSQLLEVKESGEKIIEIEQAEVAKYSKLLEKQEEGLNYYAPMCLVCDIEEGAILNIGNAVPLISNPLEFEEISQSWENVGVTINPESVELKIIRSDGEFDSHMQVFFESGMAPFINPVFDKRGEMVRGTRIASMAQVMAEKEENRQTVADPKWRKGDKVILEFPIIEDGEYPEGVLLVDEFLGIDSKRYSVFKPNTATKGMEDPFIVPSSLLGKIH